MFIYIAAPSEAKDKLKVQCGPTDDIKVIRKIIFEHFGKGYKPNCQRLIFGGKQLEDGYTLFHYNIKNTNTIQLFKKLKKTSKQSSVSTIVSKSSEQVVDNPVQDTHNFDIGDYVCEECNNDPRKNCKNCGCNTCGGKDEEEHTIVCDECQYYFHFRCLDPPLEKLPEEEYWYCAYCKHQDEDVILAGQGLDLKKSKKSKMPSAFQKKKWGGGMACVGLSKRCEIVGPDHFGAIPGIPVGSSWKYRISCSEAGVHRPLVAGIAGKSLVGAVSIVLSGGYPEDTDNGFEFIYTGSGGRDLKTGNKRTAEQTSDQKLTKTNLALALCSDAEVDSERGAKANDWKKGKPIRVCRSEKLKKHNLQFAPTEGIRYDGLYKVVRYWPEKGKAGFIVWRYEMRRDDDEPAPWTTEGKKRIAELGLTMYVPEELKDEETKKRKSNEDGPPSKKTKTKVYKPTKEFMKLVKKDVRNARVWGAVMEKDFSTVADFLSIMEEEFKCPVCIEMVQNPVTTLCAHNYCFDCLAQSVQKFGNKCVQCREEFSSEKFVINEDLVTALEAMIPTYKNGQSFH
ncbi:9445_t:CDS:1 [Acaulospora morrowiae]|uniref:RING-type E3 ubiquitin transferase n=1 Tax=Acaulospora morrowiae TaxID=94023 RepID=A0A9N8V897_9GLOM|nr:9445_t:CDS:1 [Acaulospora morrowiae]